MTDWVSTTFIGILGASALGIGIPLWGDIYKKFIRPWLKSIYGKYHEHKEMIKEKIREVQQNGK